MPTQCNIKPLEFEGHRRRRVVAAFDGGPITSDAGALLLRRVEQRLSLFDQVADCFTDHRDPDRIQHSLRTLVAQRIVAIALGYEDLNDHDQLRHDPLMALFSENRLGDSAPLAGKSTLNRLELAPSDGPDRYEQTYCARGEMENLIKEQQAETMVRRSMHGWPIPGGWRWTPRGVSTSPIPATTVFES